MLDLSNHLMELPEDRIVAVAGEAVPDKLPYPLAGLGTCLLRLLRIQEAWGLSST